MKNKLFGLLRILFVVTGLGCVASVVWAGYHYTHTDPRFNLKKVTLGDLKRVEDSDILSRIRLKTGSNTNIFAVDMEDVRARVEQIEWVHHATVQRVLPDQIVIRVAEREPTGLARINGRIVEFDDEGALLEPDSSPLPNLPILVELIESKIDSGLHSVRSKHVCDVVSKFYDRRDAATSSSNNPAKEDSGARGRGRHQ